MEKIRSQGFQDKCDMIRGTLRTNRSLNISPQLYLGATKQMQHLRQRRLSNNIILDFDKVKEPVRAGGTPGYSLVDFKKDAWKYDLKNYR